MPAAIACEGERSPGLKSGEYHSIGEDPHASGMGLFGEYGNLEVLRGSGGLEDLIGEKRAQEAVDAHPAHIVDGPDQAR